MLTWLIGSLLLIVGWFFKNVIPGNIWALSWASLFFSVIFFSLLINFHRSIVVKYNIDEEMKKIIKQRNDAIFLLLSSDKVWSIEEYETVIYSRVNAGAGTNIKRQQVRCIFEKAPHYLKVDNDMRFYQMIINKKRYIFLPDKLLIINSLKVGALSYKDIVVTFASSNFVETDTTTPKDAFFVRNTWQYVNKNGTPDRRFNSNSQYSVFKYGKIYLNSESGLNLHLMVSSVNNAMSFKTRWDKLRKMP